VGDARHAGRHVGEFAAGFHHQALLRNLEGGSTGQFQAQAVQAGGQDAQQRGVLPDLPLLPVAARDLGAETAEQFEVAAPAVVGWGAEYFSWWMTRLLHSFADASPLERRMQQAELENLVASRAMRTALAENFVGAF